MPCISKMNYRYHFYCCYAVVATVLVLASGVENEDSQLLNSILQAGAMPSRTDRRHNVWTDGHERRPGREKLEDCSAESNSDHCRRRQSVSSTVPLLHNTSLSQAWPTMFYRLPGDDTAGGSTYYGGGELTARLARLAYELEESLPDVAPAGCISEDVTARCHCPSCDWFTLGGWQKQLSEPGGAQVPGLSDILRAIDDVATSVISNLGTSNNTPSVIISNPVLNVDGFGASHRSRRAFSQQQHAAAAAAASTRVHALSAIFCITVGDSNVESNFVRFADPRPQASPMELIGWLQGTSLYEWELKPGQMLVFPSYLRYHLLVNGDPAPRTFITADILTEPDLVLSDSLVRHPWLTATPRWPTPVLQVSDSKLESVVLELAALILGLEETEQTVYKSNKGGWQSPANLFKRSTPLLDLLGRHTYAAVLKYLVTLEDHDVIAESYGSCFVQVDVQLAWANVNRLGHSNAPHTHPGATVSGVFYVSNGGDSSSQIHFPDPRSSVVPATEQGVHSVSAVPGTFVLFPSWLEHYVDGHRGPSPRISVSFNALVQRVKQPPYSSPTHTSTAGCRYYVVA